MNKIGEELKRLKEKLAENPRQLDLDSQIQDISRRLTEIRPKVAEAEALSVVEENPNLDAMKKELEELEARYNELQKRRPYADKIREEIERGIANKDSELHEEIKKKYLPEYQKAVIRMIQQWREAEKAEREVVMIAEKAFQEYRDNEGWVYNRIFPTFRRLLSNANILGVAGGGPKSIMVTASPVDLAIEDLQNDLILPENLRFDKSKHAQEILKKAGL